jgi:riboflavin synthase alpha subunit
MLVRKALAVGIRDETLVNTEFGKLDQQEDVNLECQTNRKVRSISNRQR